MRETDSTTETRLSFAKDFIEVLLDKIFSDPKA